MVQQCHRFQLTRSRGAWQEWNTEKKDITDFNSHAHVERDECLNDGEEVKVFQLTRSRGAWRWILDNLIVKSNISTHTLTWSVTDSERQYIVNMLHFNSHAHVERDSEEWKDLTETEISTHTLTWSVTFVPMQGDICIFISTHTLTWSVTWNAWRCWEW